MTVQVVHVQDISRCPLLIVAAEHWPDPYACRCGDPDYPLMKERGYVWNDDEGRWGIPT